MTYSERNRRILYGLDPVVANRVEKALRVLEMLGYDCLLTDGRRTAEEQDALFAKGRTEAGDVVTYVKGQESFHVWGVAFDLVPVFFGFLQWNNIKKYEQIAKILQGLGFQWGFKMWGFDYGHFQYTQGLTIEDFIAGKTLKEEPDNALHILEPDTMPRKRFVARLSIICGRVGILLIAKVRNALWS